MKVLCIEWLFQRKKQIAYVCRNYILAKRIYKDLLQLLPKEYITTANGSDLTITSILGSTITFFSAESGASLRGLTFNYLICDEFAFFKQEQTDGTNLWNDILFPTVKVNGIITIFVSTPLGKQNIFYDMYLKGQDPTFPSHYSILKTIYDDGLVTDEEIEEIRKQIPELSFKQEFLCQFLDGATTAFNGFEECFTKFKYQDHIPQWLGFDLSANGKDETIGTVINTLGQVKQYKIKGTLDQKYNAIADIINSTKNLKGCYVERNGVGSPMLNEILKLVNRKSIVYDWLTTNETKNEIISDLQIKIANKEIFFDEDDKELFSQFGTFTVKFTKKGLLTFSASSTNKDDRIMSLAIALRARNDLKNTTNYTFTMPNYIKIE